MSLTSPIAASKHSRAARRETAVDIDTDKSLKDVKPPTESVDYRPAVLQAHHGAGVSKKKKAGRKAVLSATARKRQERAADMAEAVMERTEIKRAKSKGKSRVIQERSKGWEEVNKNAGKLRQKFPTEEDAMEDDSADDDEQGAKKAADGGWETDEDMDAAETETAPASKAAPAAAAPVDDIDEDIL